MWFKCKFNISTVSVCPVNINCIKKRMEGKHEQVCLESLRTSNLSWTYYTIYSKGDLQRAWRPLHAKN